MVAKDTILSPEELYAIAMHLIVTPDFSQLTKIYLQTQAEVSFKAGMDECAKTHFKQP